MISRQSSVPPYLQIVADLREQITSGKLPPGTQMPPYNVLASRYGVGVGTVTRAMQHLRDSGLVETGTGSPNFVRDHLTKQVVEVPEGATLDTRMPTPEERAGHGIEPGVPVFVLTTRDGQVTTYPGDRTRFTRP